MSALSFVIGHPVYTEYPI